MRRAAPPLLFSREVRAIHCVGIAGMGLGPLAIFLAQTGFAVSGEDDAMIEAMRAHLERERIALTGPGGIPDDCDLVVCSSAISPRHPAFIAAAARKIPLVRRGELLAEVVRDRKLVAVCGSHGKTTTTAMLATVLRRANFPAGYVLGGLFNDDSLPPARVGSNEWVVAEIDESDGTIDRFSPEIAVVVNLDWDHPDYYRQQADLEKTFAALFGRTRSTVLVSDACALSARVSGQMPAETANARAGDDGAAPSTAPDSLDLDAPAAPPPLTGPRVLTFGRTGDFRGRIEDESGERQTLALNHRFNLGRATVRALGEFNASNATAALAAAQVMGAAINADVLADYPGVRRRQAVLHASDGLTVIEDYAHHPSEIRALLGSLRRRVSAGGSAVTGGSAGIAAGGGASAAGGGGRLLAVFQPHRFSRTAQFKAEFAAALALADRVYLLDVYSAGEAPVPGGTTADLYADLRKNAPSLPAAYFPAQAEAVLSALTREVRSGDLVAFVGAGDIDQRAREWLTRMAEKQTAARRWDECAEIFRANVSAATRVKREESLAEKTTLRVGGAARLYAEPASEDDLRALLVEAKTQGVTVHLLGRGSNLIVPDEGVDGLVISLAHAAWQIFEPRADGRVWVGAGLRLKNLCGLATKAGLGGFEFLEGIPGNVGGALRMNAGAMGGWMFDVVDEVRMMTRDGELLTRKRSEMHVDYRHCAELHEAIALGALLKPAAPSEAEAIGRQIDVYRDKRHKTQPREPSAGCIFKNPPGTSAGRLIDESGLKGERVGDAEVSPVHANFIVNRGSATSAEVIELVRRVRARVEEARGVKLEPEVLLYGKAWRDVL